MLRAGAGLARGEEDRGSTATICKRLCFVGPGTQQCAVCSPKLLPRSDDAVTSRGRPCKILSLKLVAKENWFSNIFKREVSLQLKRSIRTHYKSQGFRSREKVQFSGFLGESVLSVPLRNFASFCGGLITKEKKMFVGFTVRVRGSFIISFSRH